MVLTPGLMSRGSGGGVTPIFQSDWSTALGSTDAAIRDTNKAQPWTSQFDFGGAGLMTVVASGPSGYANAMRIQQRGPSFACEIDLDGVIPAATDYYLRWYQRNDDTSGTEDHIISAKTGSDDGCLIHCAHKSGASTWTFRTRCFSTGTPGYPVASFDCNFTFTNGVWYRFETFVHYTSSTTFQHKHRIFNASGTQILADSDFRQEDYGSANYLGSNTWTLQAFYDAGHDFLAADITKLQHFYMGNNGQTNSTDTGLFWYYAGVKIQLSPTSGTVWVGP